MHEVATNREEFLHNFYTKSARSVAKAHNEGPAAYVLPADDPRPGQQARLLKVMEDHAFEVQRADEDIEIGETVYPEGSYVVRMDQPFSRGADMLLDKQYYNPDDPRPYDDAGWTVGPLFNAKTVRVEDTAILDADMTLVETVTVDGGVEGRRRGTHLLNYNADNTLAAFRVAHEDLVIHAAESPFTDARDLGEAGVEAFREAQEEDEDDTPQSGGDSIGPDRVRVVMRFAQSTEDLLISGGLRNGQTLANAPAVVDVTLGDGHVVLFSFNPFWRSHTHASYALLFNTLMHHGALSAVAEEMVAEEEGVEGRPGGR